jgi:hypothetical protein
MDSAVKYQTEEHTLQVLNKYSGKKRGNCEIRSAYLAAGKQVSDAVLRLHTALRHR